MGKLLDVSLDPADCRCIARGNKAHDPQISHPDR